MISIPKDIYNHSLLVHLYPLVHRKNKNQQEAQLLQRICLHLFLEMDKVVKNSKQKFEE